MDIQSVNFAYLPQSDIYKVKSTKQQEDVL